MLKIHPSPDGLLLESSGRLLRPVHPLDWDALFTQEDPVAYAHALLESALELPAAPESGAPMLQQQEVWAAGVTYWRSRTARMSESKDAGGGSFYDKVYAADRPELFYKASPARVAQPGGAVRIRGDARWNVPEPELTLALNHQGRIFGYTIGNDMSSRDIEGENPLYLPQAKVYAGSAALGPAVLLSSDPLPGETAIELQITRSGTVVFAGSTHVSQIKRSFTSLAEYLFRDNVFPVGCYLMTGTGIVPADDFTLQSGDQIAITIAPIGTLHNVVA